MTWAALSDRVVRTLLQLNGCVAAVIACIDVLSSIDCIDDLTLGRELL